MFSRFLLRTLIFFVIVYSGLTYTDERPSKAHPQVQGKAHG
jgi:hypothetical protein